MQVAVIGLGNMGLSLTAAFLDRGLDVLGIDADAERLRRIQNNFDYLQESFANETISKALHSERLELQTEIQLVADSELIFLAVPTPEKNLNCDYGILCEVLENLNQMKVDCPVVISSTVFPKAFQEHLPSLDTEIIYHPVFLRFGFGAQDYLEAPKVIFGLSQPTQVPSALTNFCQKLFNKNREIRYVSKLSAQWLKLMHNSFMALKINFSNELDSYLQETEAGYQRELFFNELFKLDLFDHHQLESIPDHKWSLTESSLSLPLLSTILSGNEESPALKATPSNAKDVWYECMRNFFREYEKLVGSERAFQDLIYNCFSEEPGSRLWSKKQMHPGAPFAGPCLPKDLRILQGMLQGPYPLLRSLWNSNQKYADKIYREVLTELQSKENKVAVIGLGFRPGSSEYRDSFLVDWCLNLKDKADLKIFDRHLLDSKEKLKLLSRGDPRLLELSTHLCATANEAIQNAECVILNDADEDSDFSSTRLFDLSLTPRPR